MDMVSRMAKCQWMMLEFHREHAHPQRQIVGAHLKGYRTLYVHLINHLPSTQFFNNIHLIHHVSKVL